jgi:hypothetical protein
LGHGGAARHRVLDDAGADGEAADLEQVWRPGRMVAQHADHHVGHRGEVRFEGPDTVPFRGEHPHPVVGVARAGRRHEGRHGQVGPAGEGGHVLVGQTVTVQHHGDRVAAQSPRREHIHGRTPGDGMR